MSTGSVWSSKYESEEVNNPEFESEDGLWGIPCNTESLWYPLDPRNPLKTLSR